VVRRSFDEELLERVRGYRETGPYEKTLRKRKVWVEPLFGEAKEWHGMRRFRLRTLTAANIEALIIAAGQNIKRLLTFRQRGPRHLARAAALRSPAPTHSLVIGHLLRSHRVGDTEHPSRVFQHAGAFCEVRHDGRLRSSGYSTPPVPSPDGPPKLGSAHGAQPSPRRCPSALASLPRVPYCPSLSSPNLRPRQLLRSAGHDSARLS
jgi:Transposase DDE domain